LARAIFVLAQKKENADDKIAAKTVMEAEIATMEQATDALEKQRDTKLKLIGNLVHDSVPVSKNEVRGASHVLVLAAFTADPLLLICGISGVVVCRTKTVLSAPGVRVSRMAKRCTITSCWK
jgi:hypothetical protein